LFLIEIERPILHLLKKDGDITASLHHALHQMCGWMRVLDDCRCAALDAFGLRLHEVARIKGVVIAGRTPENREQERLLRSLSLGDVELYTYDDILSAVIRMVTGQVATVRRRFR